MNIKVNIFKIIKTVEIDEVSCMILTMVYGLEGSRPKTVEEVSQESGRTRHMIYHRLRNMKILGIIDDSRRLQKIELLQSSPTSV